MIFLVRLITFDRKSWLVLEPMEIVPCNGIFLSGHNVKGDESAATGELDANISMFNCTHFTLSACARAPSVPVPTFVTPVRPHLRPMSLRQEGAGHPRRQLQMGPLAPYQCD